MAAGAGTGKKALCAFLDETLTKLATPPDAETLKTKAMPAVTASIRAKLAGAPATVMDPIKEILTNNGVLPDYTADVNSFKDALKKIQHLVDPDTYPEPAAAAAEEECDVDDPFAMMGGMGGEEVYKVTAMAEKTEAELEAAQAQTKEGNAEEEAYDADDPFAMMGGMGQEEVYKVTAMEEKTEAQLEAAQAKTNGTQGPKMRDQVKDYVNTTIQKLNDSPPDEATLKGRVMPAVVNGLKNMVSKAPAEIQNKMKAVLDANGVLPSYECDLEALKTALAEILAIVS